MEGKKTAQFNINPQPCFLQNKKKTCMAAIYNLIIHKIIDHRNIIHAVSLEKYAYIVGRPIKNFFLLHNIFVWRNNML